MGDLLASVLVILRVASGFRLLRAKRKPMNHRTRKILFAIVSEYIGTGEPVGSRTLAKKYSLDLSPATVRNVLSDLEELGFLSQPHTSAGRVPTDKGFRFFVEGLLEMRKIASDDKEAVLRWMTALRAGQHDVLRETGRLLASMTGVAAVVTTPSPNHEPLKQIRFMELGRDQFLAVLVSRSGSVQNRVFDSVLHVSAKELQSIHNYLDDIVEGKNLKEVHALLDRQRATIRDEYQALRRRVSQMVEASIDENDNKPGLVIEGQQELINSPEFSDAARLRSVMKVLEERDRLLELLQETMDASGVKVAIGGESLGEASGLSVISANYASGSSTVGAVGIIGPKRMDYGKVVPIVQFTAQTVERMLKAVDADPEES